jgi:hypothetical protein
MLAVTAGSPDFDGEVGLLGETVASGLGSAGMARPTWPTSPASAHSGGATPTSPAHPRRNYSVPRRKPCPSWRHEQARSRTSAPTRRRCCWCTEPKHRSRRAAAGQRRVPGAAPERRLRFSEDHHADLQAGSGARAGVLHRLVAPLVDVPHTACLLGEGSEVLGYDTTRSVDHEWGPRVQLFVAADQVDRVRDAIANGLPPDYGGWPTAWYSLAHDAVTHHIEGTTFDEWIVAQLGVDPRHELDDATWLGWSQQRLLQWLSTDVDDFATVVAEATRVLRPGHPPHLSARRLARRAALVGRARRPAQPDRHAPRPLAELLHAFLDAGLRIDKVTEPERRHPCRSSSSCA